MSAAQPLRLSPKALLRTVINGGDGRHASSPASHAMHWARVGVLLLAGLVTLQALLLVAGAWRNDWIISRDMGVAEAEVLSAGARRSTIEFITPDRVTHRPELGVLYPSELASGMRIYVEYARSDPDLVRVRNRTAALAVIPAASVAVTAWGVAVVVLRGLTAVERRRLPDRRAPS